MNPVPDLRDQSGTSLLEVLVAAVMLIVVLFWLTQYYVEGRRHLDYEESRRRATAVAQSRVDEARRWSYDYLGALLDSSGTVPHDTVLSVAGTDYAVSLYVTPGPNPHCRTLSAVVSWDATLDYDPDNAFTRVDTVTTLVARPPVEEAP